MILSKTDFTLEVKQEDIALILNKGDSDIYQCIFFKITLSLMYLFNRYLSSVLHSINK